MILSDKMSSIYHSYRSAEKIHEIKEALKTRYQVDGSQIETIVDTVADESVLILSFFDIDPGQMKPYSCSFALSDPPHRIAPSAKLFLREPSAAARHVNAIGGHRLQQGIVKFNTVALCTGKNSGQPFKKRIVRRIV